MSKYYIEIIKELYEKNFNGLFIWGIHANVYNMKKDKIDSNTFIDCLRCKNEEFSNFEKGKKYKVVMLKEGDIYVLNEYLGQTGDCEWNI